MVDYLKKELKSKKETSKKLYNKLERTEKNLAVSKEKKTCILNELRHGQNIDSINDIVKHIKTIEELIEKSDSKSENIFEFFYYFFRQKKLENDQINILESIESNNKDISSLIIYK